MARLLVGIIAIALPVSAAAQTIEGRVIGISDGDTITVLDAERMQHKIRLAGIDAPEKRQAFGNVSKQNLARMVFQKQVTVDYEKRDRHGRIVGKVLVDGNDVCLLQIEQGLAWHFKRYEHMNSRRWIEWFTGARRWRHAPLEPNYGAIPIPSRRGNLGRRTPGIGR